MHLSLSRAARRAAAGLAALAALAACESSNGPRPQVAARLDILSGNEQEAVVGRELANPLVVKVTDDRGRPVRDQIVNFRVVSGGGSVFAGTAQTNESGEARERWTLGTSAALADSQRVEVRAVDAATGEALVFATFRATAKPDVPAAAAPVGTASRTGVAGGVVADSPAVRVADRYNNPVAGVDVAWAVASGGGAVSPASSRTDASGVAKTQWRLGGGTGAQSVTGTAAGMGPLTFVATVGAGAVSRVAIAPRELRFGSLGSRAAVSVAAFDAFGNLVGGVPVTVISLNAAVASLETGTSVQARGNGTTRLVANVGQVSDTITVAVQQVAATLTLSPTTAQRLVGDTVRLVAAARDSGGAAFLDAPVSWSTSNAAVATVSPSGLVTGTGGGSATITAASGTAQATATVTIRRAVVATALDAGGHHTCAVIQSRTYCWGSNASRQLGSTGPTTAVPTELPAVAGYTMVSGGGPATASHAVAQSCGVTAGGAVYCWGNDHRRQLSGPRATAECRLSLSFVFPCRETQEAVPGVGTAALVSTGQAHSCAVDGSGAAFCWGSNGWGELGTSASVTTNCVDTRLGTSTPCSAAPLPVAGGLSFRQLSVGGEFTCGVTHGGEGYCWGRNDQGQLGVSGIASSSTPVAVQGGHRFTSVSTGPAHACAVATDGRVLCWGSNDKFQFGTAAVLGSTPVPTTIPANVTFRSISVGPSHGCGVGTDGRAYCWGNSENGKLGIAPGTTPQLSPQPVNGTRAYSSVSVGAEHSCGVEAGTAQVYCWGSRREGAAGNTISTEPQYTPALVTLP